jgi:threonyl-tRNA synthetase
MSPRVKPDPQLEDLRNRIRHSAAHVLAEAVLSLFPNAKRTLGPPTDDGFYYDFDVERPFTPEDLVKIEAHMRESVRADHAFAEREVSREEAKRLVGNNPYKLEIIDGISEGERVTFTSHANFDDLCRGGHVQSTGEVAAFKLLSTSGSYWRGDEARPMLQRIYGTAFESKAALDGHVKRLEEAEKRDHRKVGRDLKLFFFDQMSPGMPYFAPRGAYVVNRLIEYVRSLYRRYGYSEVITPEIFSTEMWKRSGHYDNFIENMFVMQVDEREYGMKPMNCPGHALIYANDTRSYRDLPLRLADFGRLHRYERSGVLAGLLRVRSLVQDDAHIYCRVDQIGQEVNGFISMLRESYKVFGFNEARYTLSLRPEKRMGSDDIWDRAEAALESVLTGMGADFERAPGEGAFYGPKIDIFVPDAIGREWQLGTVQVDFNQAERFDLDYQAEDGSRQRPVVIHRAMLGSLERFLGVYIEHVAGAFPVWLSPVQAVVIPIADRHNAYAAQVRDRLRAAGLRVEFNDSADRMNAKIRDAQLQKVPYMLVVGDREMEAGAAAVRTRTGENLGAAPLGDIEARLLKESALPA